MPLGDAAEGAWGAAYGRERLMNHAECMVSGDTAADRAWSPQMRQPCVPAHLLGCCRHRQARWERDDQRTGREALLAECHRRIRSSRGDNVENVDCALPRPVTCRGCDDARLTKRNLMATARSGPPMSWPTPTVASVWQPIAPIQAFIRHRCDISATLVQDRIALQRLSPVSLLP